MRTPNVDGEVGSASLGCQVVRGNWDDKKVRRYFWLLAQDPTGIYKYTLIDASSLPAGASAFAKMLPGYDETAARQPGMSGPPVGLRAGFLFLAGIAAATFAILYVFMPETRDRPSLERTQ